MADKRADLSGNPEDFEEASGTAKLERKKVVLGRSNDDTTDDKASETDENVRTADLRDRMKLTLKRRQPGQAPAEEQTAEVDEEPTRDLAPERLGTERVIKKGTERVVKKQITPEPEERPKAAGSNKSDSQRMLRPKSLAGMSDEEKIQTQELLPHEMDPSRRRETDTANLKRIRPGKTSAEGVSAAGEAGTDTIHLRVIKEKKNQLKNILSASQTIRLRPSPTDTGAQPRQQQAAAPSTEATQGDGEKKRTLKIKAPSTTQEEPPTESLQKPKTAPIQTPATKEDPRTAAVNRDQLKQTIAPPTPPAEVPTQLKRKGDTETEQKAPSTDTVRLKSPQRPEGEEGAAIGKSTLKIKAPARPEPETPAPAPVQAKPPVGPTDTRPVPTSGTEKTDKKGTLKIKAPVAGEVAQGAEGEAAVSSKQTVKQPAPAAAGGKTLKLKAAPKAQTMKTPAAAASRQTVRQAAPALAAEGAPEEEDAMMPESAYVAAPEDEPGLVYTLGAAASLLIGGAAVVLSAMQFFALY